MPGMLLSLLVLMATPDAGVRDPLVLARPFHEVVPKKLPRAAPLIVLIHGLGSDSALIDEYFKLSPLVNERGFILAVPDGTEGPKGRAWNGTDVCCSFGEEWDDVGYLVAVIRDLQRRYRIDPKRIFLVGHSNGGFMSHRLACEHPELIAGFVSLAGSNWSDPSKCTPKSPVNVLQVHGTADPLILYSGGPRRGAVHPGAEGSLAIWAMKNGCKGKLVPKNKELDLETQLEGAETEVLAYEGCPASGALELWRMREGGHLPKFTPAWAPSIVDWLLAHPKK
jgi:polyhydroxybutyrate depolymerase